MSEEEFWRQISRLDFDDEETLRLAKQHIEGVHIELLTAIGGVRDEDLHTRVDQVELQLGDIGELSVSDQIRFIAETTARTEAALADIARALHIVRFKLGVLFAKHE